MTSASASESINKAPFLWKRIIRIFRMGWPYKYRLGLSILLSGLSVIVALVLPLGLRELLDAAIYNADRTSLNQLALLLLGLYLFRAVLNFIGPLILRLTGEQISIDLRHRVYKHLHSLGLRFFVNQRTGDLLSRLMADVGAIRSAITDISISFVLQSAKLAGSVALMIMLNWRLSIVIFLVTPIASIISRIYGPRVQTLSRELQDRQGDANSIAQEGLSGIRLVKAFDRASYEVSRFRHAMGKLFVTTKSVAIATTGLHVIVELIFMIAIVIIFWYGGMEVLSGRLTAGDFVAFMFYAQNIAQGMNEIIRQYTSANRIVGASGRVFEILDTQPDVIDSPAAITLRQIQGELSFEKVTFGYEKNEVTLKDLSFTIAPGERIAVVGLSGAGKTTLLHLMLRFFDPTNGCIRLDGHDLRMIKISALRQQISVVSQDVYLFGGTIRDNIRYGRLNASDIEIEHAAKAAQLGSFIQSLPKGYDTVVGENGMRLSGGERQRVAIARALLKDAPVLLLDEATSSVDAVAEVAIREATDFLQRGRTTVIITHRLESIRDVPRILVLDRGILAADGAHETLLSDNGLYTALVSRWRKENVAVH